MKVVISGSFRKHLTEILQLKQLLEKDGISVEKPVNEITISNLQNPGFIKFLGEENKSEQELEQEYLKSIFESDAHIIYNKDGYIGDSALMELCMGAGNYIFSGKKETRVYLVYPIQNFCCEYKDKPYRFVHLLIELGIIKIGIENMYKDFNIEYNSLKVKSYEKNYQKSLLKS